MTKEASSHQCSGDKIRERRVQLGMTQDKLAAMSDTNVRTIQRAESSASVQMETVGSIAAALQLTVADIVQKPILDDAGNELDEFNVVVLRPTSSGKVLLDMICGSFSTKLECEAEPTAENIEALSAVVERLEGILPDPWRAPVEDVSLTLAEKLREAVSLSKKLAELEKSGICVYAGSYTASAQVPHYSMDDGMMYVGGRQKPEPVTACRVLIDRAGLERVVHEVNDKWEQPARQPAQERNIDDEVPF